MDKDICRAITFINYHIPPVINATTVLPYITLGFFDGMQTESLDVCYEEDELKGLWKYSIKLANDQQGQYSFQNIFCFSRDEWNPCGDKLFWDEATDKEYPLTFIVFLQLREYMQGEDAIQQQCEAFNKAAHEKMGAKGLCYTYSTIDKNDFVVCLKCRRYDTAVRVIKSLHRTGAEIIYSYSVFSVLRKVLSELDDVRYQYIFDEEIDSISMKGITNSYGLRDKVTLDWKYYEYCNKLADKLYEGQENRDGQFGLYDILGDNDFHLIARQVKLGRLLRQFAPGGLLCYEEETFRFYFFSSSIMINTLTPKAELQKLGEIDKDYIIENRKEMNDKFQSPFCRQLEEKMDNISRIVSGANLCVNERVITFCHALWQLLQSLKPLETAPAKNYDFWSLYYPFLLFAEIMEEKLENACGIDASEEDKDFVSNEQIYEFIHKISMTLHGTLRTDIQFFQVQDFNVIVHYAPAKLRAFYSFWVLRLTEFYNEFNEGGKKNQYSFIVSPGMYRQTGVSELYTNYAETKRLILIKVPERHLYAIRWFPVILAHEVSHFVGYVSRRRMKRHFAWVRVCARVLFLEMNFCRYLEGKAKWAPELMEGIARLRLDEEMAGRLREEELEIRRASKKYPHEFHSKNSFKIIRETFRTVNNRTTPMLISDDTERLNSFLKQGKNIERLSFEKQCHEIEDILEYSNCVYEDLLQMNRKFESNLLPQLLRILKFICNESYADLVAILTLGLEPKEYIFSFRRGEFNIEEDRIAEGEGALLLVRAGLTMQVVMNIASEKPSCFSKKFCEKWSGEVLKELARNLDKNSIERNIVIDIYGYVTRIRDCNEKIQDYISIYNYAEDTFSNRILDFLNDEAVWSSLLDYLDESARAYVSSLSNDRLRKMQQKLLDTYDKVSRGSMSSMSQEIENFLAEYEFERKEVERKEINEKELE